jgi:glycosyltransferase involved in cell wall biosynthesis
MLSIVIPTYTITKSIEEMTIQAILSYKPFVEEIIITEDGGMFSPQIVSLVDKYIYTKNNQGFVKNVNQGWKLATEAYVAIVNSDTRLNTGSLRDLCIPNKITSPITRGQDVPLLAGHFFVCPRTFGTALLDERFKMFCSDADLEVRYGKDIQQVDSVSIWHELNQTIKLANLMDGTQLEKDREVGRILWSR